MARAGRQDDHIARLQREDPPLLAAEASSSLATRDAEHFMDPGVIVHIVVDAVAPGVSPSVRFEEVFDHGRRIVAVIERDSLSIDNHRPARMIGDETVVLEADGQWFSRLDEVRSLPLAGSP